MSIVTEEGMLVSLIHAGDTPSVPSTITTQPVDGGGGGKPGWKEKPARRCARTDL